MKKLIDTLSAYVPRNEQEEKDRLLMLAYAAGHPDCLTRKDENAHFTASAWIVDEKNEQVCFVYHKLYDSWSWVGGHADGDEDLSAVAVREASEETGLTVKLCAPNPVSLEILSVAGHIKRGAYVSSHLHYNLTYRCQADICAPLRIKPDENTGVRWFLTEDALLASTEPWLVENVYKKLIERTKVANIT